METSKVLALKYRPKNFDELVGQESVSKTLKYSLENNRLANAYLFSGLRGSGKTSSARIFAKTILCEKAPTSTPCEICSSCEMANNSSHIDIIEMDAASNRKIDDIRDLIEQTQYQPSIGKYKIFIIDEVHMLTKEAFNALLKTLEEPPPYIKFILATTDPLKLPTTILSRTQHFSFKRIDKKLIEKHLKYILGLEDVKFDNQSIETIVRSGDGSLRDTLTILQQGIVYCNNSLNIEDITEMLGLIDPETLDNILRLIVEKDRTNLLKAVENLQSYDVELIIDEFINLLKSKIFDKELDSDLLEKIFRALNSGKTLLFTGADSGFTLYLIFLQMISDDIQKKVVFVEKEVKSKVVETKSIEDTPQTIVENQNYGDFFRNIIIPNILMANPEGKITDEVLGNCIKEHIEFMDFNENIISVKFCFNENVENRCKNILRARFVTIKTVIILEFNIRHKQKTIFKHIQCKKEPENSNIQVEKQIIEQECSSKPEIQENFFSNIKEVFRIEDRNIVKIELKAVKKEEQQVEYPIATTKQDSFFDTEDQIDFTFDVESNGFRGSDLLSISFIISNEDNILEKQDRYYFPEKDFELEAQKIHGLTSEKIEGYRIGKDYPRYFKDDLRWLLETIREKNVNNFVAHNIGFDMSFMPSEIQSGVKSGKYSIYCTMEKNKEFVGVSNGKGFKNPKLAEACEKRGIEFDESEAHDSNYDTLKAFELYRKTVKRLK